MRGEVVHAALGGAAAVGGGRVAVVYRGGCLRAGTLVGDVWSGSGGVDVCNIHFVKFALDGLGDAVLSRDVRLAAVMHVSSDSCLETVLALFVADDGVKEGGDHLGDDPDLGRVSESIHTNLDASLSFADDRGIRSAGLVDVHDESRKERVYAIAIRGNLETARGDIPESRTISQLIRPHNIFNYTRNRRCCFESHHLALLILFNSLRMVMCARHQRRIRQLRPMQQTDRRAIPVSSTLKGGKTGRRGYSLIIHMQIRRKEILPLFILHVVAHDIRDMLHPIHQRNIALLQVIDLLSSIL